MAALLNPDAASPPLDVGRWYRGRWNVHKGDGVHVLDVIPMNVTTGWYDVALPAAQTCRRRAWPTGKEVDVSQSVWLGFDGGADASRRLRGRLDNVQISNYWAVVGDPPAGCLVQQP